MTEASQTIARLRDIRFDELRLAETLTPLLETLGGALDASSVLLLQEGGEFWEVVGVDRCSPRRTGASFDESWR